MSNEEKVPVRERIGVDYGKTTQKKYIKKIFITQVTMMVFITHLDPDILECEVKWALGSITMNKASRGDGIQLSHAVKVLHSIYQQIWKTQQWPQDWKRSILIPVPKKGSTKEYANRWTIALISHANGSVHLLSHVQPFATPWTAARQAFLFISNSQSLLKLMSI